MARMLRPAASITSATAVRPGCRRRSSRGIGSRRRQFGCWSMVAGTLAWSRTPSASSIAITRRRAGVPARKRATAGNRRRSRHGRAAHCATRPARSRAPSSVSPGSMPSARLTARSWARAPTREGREIMGAERHQGILPVGLRRQEAPVRGALEQHHLVGPDAPVRQRLAKILRHGSEILADHDAALLHALLRGDRQQRLERKADIDALPGPHPVRDQEQALEPQHMIEPDGAGVAHRGAQHLPERLELPRLQGNRIERRQAPILPGGVVEVGRRSDREPGHDGILIAPGIEAVRLHPDRDVEIKPDRQGQILRALAAGGELLDRPPIARTRNSRWPRHRARAAPPAPHRWDFATAAGHCGQGVPNRRRRNSKQANRARTGPRSRRKSSNAARRAASAPRNFS